MHTSRRDLLLAGACAASTAMFGSVVARLRAEEANPPPETATIRLAKNPSICIAPQYVVSDLLNAEGFANVVYVKFDAGVEQTKAIAKGDIDFTLHFSGPLLLEIDRGASITVVAGVHVGCFELFAKEGIRSVADLKGRTVGQQGVGSSPHVFISAMATLVGLDPAKDIEWVTSASVKPIELFAEGKIDAFLDSLRSHSVCVRRTSVMSSLTVRRIAHGRSIIAACWRGIVNSYERIPSRLNV